MAGKSKAPRLTLVFLTCVLAVPTVPGLIYGEPELTNLEASQPYLMVGAALGLCHLFLRPLLRLLSAPLGCLTLGLSGTVIDVALIYICAHVVPDFPTPELLCAVLTALLINAVAASLGRR